jgi:hypothetical protein
MHDTIGAAHSPLLNDLRSEVAKRKALFVVGAGVSIMASGNAPTASWKGLLRDGVQRVKDLMRCNIATAERISAQIESDDLVEMLGAATFVAKKLGGPGDGEFRRWLNESIGQNHSETTSSNRSHRGDRLRDPDNKLRQSD